MTTPSTPPAGAASSTLTFEDSVQSALRSLEQKSNLQVELLQRLLQALQKAAFEPFGVDFTEVVTFEASQKVGEHSSVKFDAPAVRPVRSRIQSSVSRSSPAMRIQSSLSRSSPALRNFRRDQSGVTNSRFMTGSSTSRTSKDTVATVAKAIENVVEERKSKKKSGKGIFVGARISGPANFANISNRAARKVWQFLEDSSSSFGACIYNYFVTLLILVCVVLSSLALLEFDAVSANIQVCFELFFFFEICLRFACCPNRCLFWCNAYNLIDFSIVLQIALRSIRFLLSTNLNNVSWIVTFFPTFLLLRLLRRFEKFHLLTSAFYQAFEALPVMLYTAMLIALIFAGCIYLAEDRSNVPGAGDALWLTIVTMSTVGYGDMSPTTPLGKVLVGGLTVISGLYMAIPIGIVGTAFSNIWQDRERLMLMKFIRDRIARAGYTPQELSLIFQELDVNGDCRLSLEEFLEILPLMEIEVRRDICERIFDEFDHEKVGEIDFNDFLAGIFPAHKLVQRTNRVRNSMNLQKWGSWLPPAMSSKSAQSSEAVESVPVDKEISTSQPSDENGVDAHVPEGLRVFGI